METLQVLFWVLFVITALGLFWEPAPPSPMGVHLTRVRIAIILLLVGILGWVHFHGIH